MLSLTCALTFFKVEVNQVLVCIEFRGDLIISGLNDHSIKVWDLKGRPGAAKCVREFKNAPDSHIFDVKARVGRVVRLGVLYSPCRTLTDDVHTALRMTKRLSLWISLPT